MILENNNIIIYITGSGNHDSIEKRENTRVLMVGIPSQLAAHSHSEIKLIRSMLGL